MLALIFDGQVRVRSDYPAPKPARGEALIAVRAAGICRTDLEIVKGYMKYTGVMGHEFVGTVVEGPRRWKHKRVVAEINCVCGRCDMCTSGLSNHCRERTVVGIDGRDGVFAEYVALPTANLHEVPEGVGDLDAVFVEPLAAACQVVRQVKIGPSENVVVLGDGRLGQLVVRVLKSHAGELRATAGKERQHRRDGSLLLVGKHPSKLEAAEKQGVQTTQVDEFVPRGRADLVIDATGRPEGLELALRTVRPRGTIVLKSTFAAGAQLDLAPLVIDDHHRRFAMRVLSRRAAGVGGPGGLARKSRHSRPDLQAIRPSRRPGGAAGRGRPGQPESGARCRAVVQRAFILTAWKTDGRSGDSIPWMNWRAWSIW